MLAVETGVTERVGSHPLTGPIYVDGAEPGDVLEVRFLDIGFLTPYGVSGFVPGGGTLPDDFPYAGLRRFEIDTTALTAIMGIEAMTEKTLERLPKLKILINHLTGLIINGVPAEAVWAKQVRAAANRHARFLRSPLP